MGDGEKEKLTATLGDQWRRTAHSLPAHGTQFVALYKDFTGSALLANINDEILTPNGTAICGVRDLPFKFDMWAPTDGKPYPGNFRPENELFC